jgi:hypothetical protein
MERASRHGEERAITQSRRGGERLRGDGPGIDDIRRTELLAQRRLVDLAGGVARQGMTNLIRRGRLKRARLASQWA